MKYTIDQSCVGRKFMNNYSLMFTCPSCGSVEYRKEGRMLKCQHCGNLYRDNLMDDPIYVNLQYAVNKRQEANFDEARRKYESLIAQNKGKADLEEVYWGHFLCEQYVIFYQNDAGESIPSFWNINDEPCTSSQSFKKALELGKKSGNADNYQKLAERIQEYKQKYKRVQKEFPDGYQVFICFKNSGTTDANLGYKLYNEFSRKYNIFFSCESLNTISGNDYEPYIYHALKTAKVMIVLCSDKQNLESKWVYNEWWRFWNFSKGTDKTIIPIFRHGFNASSLPDEIRNCQAHAEDVDLISNMSIRLSAILKNDSAGSVPLTSFEKKLNEVELTINSGNFDDAKIMAAELVRQSVDRPFDNISALMLQARVLSNNYKNLKSQNAKAAITKATELAKTNDIQIKDVPQYGYYQSIIAKKRLKTILLAVICAIVIAGTTLGAVMFMQDPYVDMYIPGHPDTIEIAYGDNPISAIPDIMAVSKKGKETKIELNESMISGFDPSKLGVQQVTVTYGDVTIQINISVQKYRLSIPESLTVENGRITWSAVEKAECYTLSLNDRIIENIMSNSCDASVLEDNGIYSVKVKAVSDEKYGHDSDYSAPVSIIRLKEASDITINGMVLSWSPVANCSKYDIYLNDVRIASSAFNSYTVPEASLAVGKNVFYAVPVDASNIKLAANLSENEIDNYEHNGEVICYTSEFATNVKWNSGVISWDAALGTATYSIFLNDQLIGTSSGTSYTPDTTKFKIGKNSISVKSSNGVYLVEGSATVAPLELIALGNASDTAFNGTVLSWSSVSGCNQYNIYLNGNLISSSTSNNYTVSNEILSNGKNTFSVVPVNAVNVKNITDLDSSEALDYQNNSCATFYKYANSTDLSWNGEKFSWSAAKGDVRYCVYINGKLIATTSVTEYIPDVKVFSVGLNEVYVTVGAGSGGFFTDTASSNTTFENNGIITVRKLAKVTGITVNNMIISWTRVDGATEYEIYKNGTFLIKISGTTYAIPSDIATTSAVYTIKALGNNVTIASDISSESAKISYLSVPTGVKLEGNVLSWNAVENAIGYDIYSNGTLIHSTTGSSTFINLMGKLTIGTYEISVAAKGDGNAIFSSSRSSSVSYTVTQNIVYITTEEELRNVCVKLDETYVLGNDITIKGTWTPIGTTAKPFVGQFNGGGYTIYGLTLNSVSGQGTGLFGVIGESGVVENLKIANISANNQKNNNIGALAGINYGTVRQIEVLSGAISSDGNYIGGIIGRNEGSAYECINRSNISGNRYVGGIMGKADCNDSDIRIYNCSNYGTVDGVSNVGGIAGDILVSKKNTIYGLTNNGDVKATGNYAGGCIGYVSGSNGQTVTLNNCSNSAKITANDYASGCFNTASYVIVTVNNAVTPSQNCLNTGKISTLSGSNWDDIYTR